MKNKDLISSFYKSKEWKKLRSEILRRDGYICMISKRYGKNKQADTVHHIYPARDYPELFFNANNLISVSNNAHNKLHDRNTDDLSDEGKRLQQRTRSKIFGQI